MALDKLIYQASQVLKHELNKTLGPKWNVKVDNLDNSKDGSLKFTYSKGVKFFRVPFVLRFVIDDEQDFTGLLCLTSQHATETVKLWTKQDDLSDILNFEEEEDTFGYIELQLGKYLPKGIEVAHETLEAVIMMFFHYREKLEAQERQAERKERDKRRVKREDSD